MPKIFSKLIRKIPPFRTIYARLDYLDTVRKEQKKQIDDCRKTIADVRTKLNNLQTELNDIKKELSESQKELSDADKKIIKLENTAQNFTKQQTELKKQLSDLRKKEEKDDEKMHKRLLTAQKELSKDINYYYYKGLHPDQYEENLKEIYYRRTGGVLDLEHPKTYNEKMQWLKLYDKNPLKTELSDKYQVRAWVADKIGEQYLVPLLGVYDKFDDIDFEQLPDQFVIKTNHASTSNWIVEDKSALNYGTVKKFFDRWMQRNFAFWNGLELHYKPIVPKIIVEEYMDNNGKELNDYKVFCFHGKAYYIMYYADRGHGTKMAIFDREWNLMPFTHSYPQYTEPVPKPGKLEELLCLAETLSKGFIHVRVDFYILDDGSIRFGEMTFTTASGTSPWQPKEYDRILGDLMRLPIDEDE